MWIFRKKFALGISAGIDLEHPLEEEFRHVNQAFVEWLRRRGSKCTDLILAFEAPYAMGETIAATCEAMLNQDLGFDEVVAKLDVEIVVIDPITNVKREFAVRPRANSG